MKNMCFALTWITVLFLTTACSSKPDLRPIVRQTNGVSLLVFRSDVVTFWDLRTTFRKNMHIVVSNKTTGKTYCSAYYQNGLSFIPNLPDGIYKISHLYLPSHGDVALAVYGDDGPIDYTQSDRTNYDMLVRVFYTNTPFSYVNTYGDYDEVTNIGIDTYSLNLYNNFSRDFTVKSPGSYYLGNFVVSNFDLSLVHEMYVIRKAPDRDSVEQIKNFLTNTNTLWSLDKIIYVTNVFFTNTFSFSR